MAIELVSQAVFEIRVGQELSDYFERLTAGLDVSPAERFRLEGYIAAGVELGLLDRTTVDALITEQLYKHSAAFPSEIANEKMSDGFIVCSPLKRKLQGEGAEQEIKADVRLPYLMQRAPVFPSS